eukprot:TRINITY_DN8467_c0_g1_i2.p2 TRINITY_DN8467_c0_g1~~TRINITY_DN8467_c0_g1_i2.p2  ORF type:complete len:120 (+),score=34.99 TRINITY_DN8467_c0_g1_i2:344-703(+)
MTVEEAFVFSCETKDCVGFCFEAASTTPGTKVELFFKSKKYASGVEDGPGWHTYLKKGYAKKVREMDSFADVKGVKDLTKIRTLTEEGFKIYGEDELKINQDPQATFTEDCPFDCQCCF